MQWRHARHFISRTESATGCAALSAMKVRMQAMVTTQMSAATRQAVANAGTTTTDSADWLHGQNEQQRRKNAHTYCSTSTLPPHTCLCSKLPMAFSPGNLTSVRNNQVFSSAGLHSLNTFQRRPCRPNANLLQLHLSDNSQPPRHVSPWRLA